MSTNPLHPRSQSRVTDLDAETAAPGTSGHGALTPRDVLAVLRRRWAIVVALTAAGAAVATYVAAHTELSYRAAAVLQLGNTRGSITEGIAGTPQLTSDRTNPLLSQVQLLNARSLIGRIVDSEGLRIQTAVRELSPALVVAAKVNDAATNEDTLTLVFSGEHVSVVGSTPPIRAKYGEPLRTPDAEFVVTSHPGTERASVIIVAREKAIDLVLERLRVTPRDQTDVVEVSYTDSDPGRAQRVVNTLVRSYQSANAQAARALARRRREFLEEQLRVINPRLAEAERRLTDFRSRHEVFDSGNRIQAEQTALMTLDLRRQEFEADRSMYKSLLSALEKRKTGAGTDHVRSTLATADGGNNPVIVQLYQQLAQYEASRDSLTTGQWRSAPTNPDVSRLDTLVALAERRLMNAVQGHVSVLDARVTALDTLRARNVAAIQRLPVAQSTEERLSREVVASRTLVDDLNAEHHKARMAEAVEVGQVEIVDLAARPYRAEPGLRLLKLLAGTIFGLVLGVVGAFLRERTNVAIRRRGELESELRVPVLSIIPRMYSSATSDSTSRFAAMLGRKTNAEPLAGTLVAPKSPADAEAYRVLRTNLRWASNGSEPQKTLVVTSAVTREGKSMISANLALAFALEGRETLLIDCDLRRGRLHSVFGVPRSPGLAHVLRGFVTPATAIRTTFLPGLHFLPAGRLSSLPSDLLGVSRTSQVLGELSQRFDVVILDTPPVLAVADAAILAAEAGGVLLVVRAGETDREAVNQALRQLDVVGARLLGAVLNDPSGEVKRYGDYYATTDYDAVGD